MADVKISQLPAASSVAAVDTAPVDQANVSKQASLAVLQNSAGIFSGTGAPSITAPNGSLFLRSDGGASTTLYVRAAGVWSPIKESYLQLISGTAIDPTFTATGTARYYWNSSGFLVAAADNTPRFDWDPNSHALLGCLIEPSRQNLLKWSEDISNGSVWGLNAVTITADNTAAPDGATTADKVVEAATAAEHGANQFFTGAQNTDYTHSFFYKPSGRTWLYIQARKQDNTFAVGYVNCSGAGTIGSNSGWLSTPIVQQLPNGWYRVICSYNSATGASGAQFFCQFASGDGGKSYTGDGVSGGWVWGAVVEAGSFATSYIKTTSATVTRGADVLTISSFPFSATPGTLYAEFRPALADSLTRVVASIDDGTNVNKIALQKNASNQIVGLVRASNVDQANITGGAVTAGAATKAVLAWASNDVRLCDSGTLETLDLTATIPVTTTLRAGSDDGTNTPFFGWLAELRYYGSRQSDATLQSITGGGAAPLVGKFMSPTGSDAATGTEAAPWRTLAASLPKLTAGTTLYCRGGTYTETGITISGVNGSAGNPITITNYPGETPIFDGGYTQFRTIGNSDWTVFDGARSIYRSAITYTASAGSFGSIGGKIDIGGKLIALISYQSLGGLSSDTQTCTSDGVYYLGPGFFYDTSTHFIYIRLAPLSAANVYSRSISWPSNVDPAQNKIYFAPIASYALEFSGSTSSYLTFDGLTFQHNGGGTRISSASNHITFKNNTWVVSGPYCHVWSYSNLDSMLIDNDNATYNVPVWMAWCDTKVLAQPARWNQGDFIEIAGVFTRTNIEIKNSRIAGFFDGMTPVGTGINGMKVHHNDWIEIWDDMIQLSTDSINVEINNNYVYGPGPSHNESGASPSTGNLGTVWVHHNIIDCRWDRMGKKPDPLNLINQAAGYAGWQVNSPFETHGSAPLHEHPWKIYNNTIIYGDRHTSGRPGLEKYTASVTHVPHEVFNNIVDTWDGSSGPFVVRGARVDDGDEIFDGNCYFRNVSSGSFFEGILNGASAATFTSLALFIASAHYTASKTKYAPGWETSGLQTDPQIAAGAGSATMSDYTPNSTVQSGGVDISGKSWPGVDGTYRGAIKPGTDGTQIGKP